MKTAGWLALVVMAVGAGCAADAGSQSGANLDDEWGMDGALSPTPPPGKEDSEYRKGLLVNTDTTRTQVWTARNQWEDTTTPAARAPGLAWGADSGLTWDAKYGAWIASLAWVPSTDGYSTTVQVTTPWGKTLPSPSLECAEMSLFLRITFSAWYELPLVFETIDERGHRVYFGHNGVRTAAGRYANSPEFAIKYKDYSKAPVPATWPKDSTLRTKHIAGGTDDQAALGGDGHAPFGQYLDELHLNKRVGYFTVMALDYLGSVNVADSANTYNVVPDSVRAGDSLIERWQRDGIGHTLVVKAVMQLPGGSKDVTTISGSMPRRQGVRQSGQSSKSYFTSEYTGGVGMTASGDLYSHLGGGLKRWRVAKNVGGYWTNTWMAGDEASWINSTDYARIAARPARFDQILGQVSPAQQRGELVVQIADARQHLAQYPASCSARENRERAFQTLYELSARAFGESRAEVDGAYRTLEDYVFAALDYTASKTCCWDSSTAGMHDIIVQQAEADEAAATAAMQCQEPVVFAARTDGYARWSSYAASIGRGGEWRPWAEDESCPQRAVAQDTVAPDAGATLYCELEPTDPGAP